MIDVAGGDGSTKALIVMVVFPTSFVVFSFLAELPLGIAAHLVSGGSKVAVSAAEFVGYVLGGSTAIWTCRFAWPKAPTDSNRKAR